ncbi:23S rRNA (pseudouridine(1915)-N(3))-methyltransferase RlmH [Candidatus Woesearchaeota archaeon]|nr:23S rRNA (pseudouridine(1915)-N(3))-methyltransferase RlmH [Candidatus Woesearchaeota archaeon]
MKKIRIIAVGKIKEPYLRDAIAEYKKRLGRFCDLLEIELKEARIDEHAVAVSQAKESKDVLDHLSDYEIVIVLDRRGKELSSEEFAVAIKKFHQEYDIAFVIGGSTGLSQNVLRRANLVISFSQLTFTHQMMRLFLIEQIYRAYTIMNNLPYHK